jgi:hypothetical protein
MERGEMRRREGIARRPPSPELVQAPKATAGAEPELGEERKLLGREEKGKAEKGM